jgi:hypothetical protein
MASKKGGSKRSGGMKRGAVKRVKKTLRKGVKRVGAVLRALPGKDDTNGND